MKKLYNKALMYDYYYCGRWPLFFGIIMFMFVSYFNINANISNVCNEIAYFEGDTIHKANFNIYITSWLIIFGVYFSITGLNKRNSMEFVYSGPFSKEDIKKNQILTLVISLFIICICYAYIFSCITFRQHEIIPMISNYYSQFFDDLLRLLICGMAFISYLILMDMLFSNIILEIIMLILTPFLCILSLGFFVNIYCDIWGAISYQKGFLKKIFDIIDGIYSYALGYFDEKYLYFSEGTIIFIIINLTSIFFITALKLNKSFKMNNADKLYNFKAALIVSQVLIVFTFVLKIFETIVHYFVMNGINRLNKEPPYLILFGIIILCIVITYVLRKILDKMMKKYL